MFKLDMGDDNFTQVKNYSDSVTLEDFSRLHKEGIKFMTKPLPYPSYGLEPVIPEKLISFHNRRNQDAYPVNANALMDTIDEIK